MSKTQAARALQDVWASWINEEYVAPWTLASTVSALRRGDPCASLDNFWRLEQVRALQAALSSARWEPLHLLRIGDDVQHASEAEFANDRSGARFSTHEVMKGIVDLLYEPGLTDSERALADFISFVSGPGMSSWMAALTGNPKLLPKSAEFARYVKGSYIDWHNDVVPGRMYNIATYLDEGWHPEDGGELSVRDASETVWTLLPAFNRIVFLTIHPTHSHRVSAWLRNGPGRHAASVSFGLKE